MRRPGPGRVPAACRASGARTRSCRSPATLPLVPSPYRGIYLLLFISAVLTAGLTAFYTFRAYFLTFWGEERIPHEAGHHAHESPPVMTVPLAILAVGAVGVGIVVEPFTHWFSGFLMRTPFVGEAPEAGVNWGVMALSSIVALAGIAAAWWMYVRQPGSAGRLAGHIQALYQLSLNKFHLDELYDFFIVQPLPALRAFAGSSTCTSWTASWTWSARYRDLAGILFRPIQNGLVQFYALAMVLGLTVFLIALVRALAR